MAIFEVVLARMQNRFNEKTGRSF